MAASSRVPLELDRREGGSVVKKACERRMSKVSSLVRTAPPPQAVALTSVAKKFRRPVLNDAGSTYMASESASYVSALIGDRRVSRATESKNRKSAAARFVHVTFPDQK